MGRLQEFKRSAAGIFYFSCILGLTPPILLLALPLWIFRAFLTKIQPIVCPFHGKFLTGLSSVFAQPSPYTGQNTSFVTYVVAGGQVDFKEFRLHVIKKLCEFKRWLVYPQVQQELRTWYGFPVWKEIRKFRIDNQVRLLETKELQNLIGSSQVINDANISQVAHTFSVMPYNNGTSPWEIIVCHEVKSVTVSSGPATAIFLRFHHSLGDSPSILKLVLEFFNCENEGNDPKETPDDALCHYKLHIVLAPLQAFQWLLRFISDTWNFGNNLAHSTDFNAWHTPWTPKRSSYVYTNCVIPTEQIKRISKMSQVSFFSAIATAQMLAITKLLRLRREQLPKILNVLVSMPTRNRDRQLQNNQKLRHISFAPAASNQQRHLDLVDEDYANNKSENTFVSLATSILGILPRGMLPPWIFRLATGIITFVPIVETNIRCLDTDVTSVACVATLPSNAGFYTSSMCYNGKTTICTGFSEEFALTDKEKKAFVKSFLREFQLT